MNIDKAREELMKDLIFLKNEIIESKEDEEIDYWLSYTMKILLNYAEKIGVIPFNEFVKLFNLYAGEKPLKNKSN